MSNEVRAERGMDVVITPDDPANPKWIRFDLYRTPYAEEQDPRLSVYERIRLGMRKFASEQLASRSLCTHGFNGPSHVYVPENDIEHRFFHVECLPSK